MELADQTIEKFSSSEPSDFIVIGAGMAGASVAYELAALGRVTLLEREDQPGYHTTGRSAALFLESYGNATMRALARAGRGFYLAPPPGFASTPILTPRGSLLVGTAVQREALEAYLAASSQVVQGLAMWSGAQVRERVPAFTPQQVDAAVWEPDAMDIDVHALHQGFLRGMRARGGLLRCGAEVEGLASHGGRWQVPTRAGDFSAPVLVNAAGAWAEVIGQMAGAAPIGLRPLRRTAITFDAPAGASLHDWPAVVDVDETYYFKPEGGRLLASPADETPSPPCDAQPEDYDIAVLVDRLCKATTLKVPRIHSRWAGLRSFVADRTLVAGYDPRAQGFFWLAGQGGYGIQTAAGASRAAAALITGRALPSDLQDLGVRAEDLAASRSCIGARP